MKSRITKKSVMAGYSVIISVGYCQLQHLLKYRDPIYYTTRREGWGADVYCVGGAIAIVTGYAPFGNVEPSREVLLRYENEANKICKNRTSWEAERDELDKLIWKFIEEIESSVDPLKRILSWLRKGGTYFVRKDKKFPEDYREINVWNADEDIGFYIETTGGFSGYRPMTKAGLKEIIVDELKMTPQQFLKETAEY